MNEPHQAADNGSTLQAYERSLEKWRRWLRNDPHQALWPQIYSMLLADMTFRAIAAAADADPESALHSPILVRAITTGYASDQALSVRRLTDMTRGMISLRKLVGELRNNLGLMTRDNFVCAGGLSYDENLMGIIGLTGWRVWTRQRVDMTTAYLGGSSISWIAGWTPRRSIRLRIGATRASLMPPTSLRNKWILLC
jgi:hypothetical protein